MSVRIQLRRRTAAQWLSGDPSLGLSANPVLAQGEPGVEIDTDKFKFGDGISAWSALAYFTGAANDPTITPKLASGTIVGHRVVRCIDAAEVAYTDVTDANQVFSTLGISLNSSAPGDVVNVKTEGEVTEPSWTWTPLMPIFLTANGMMSQTAPTQPTAAFVLSVGYALSATTMRVQIGIPIVLT
jgi:hypothetical protein